MRVFYHPFCLRLISIDSYVLVHFLFQVRSDGAGTMDYVIEFVINVLPNLLRFQIMDALENPAKARIQEEMNKINVERLIKKNIPTFEKMSKKNMDLSINDFRF